MTTDLHSIALVTFPENMRGTDLPSDCRLINQYWILIYAEYGRADRIQNVKQGIGETQVVIPDEVVPFTCCDERLGVDVNDFVEGKELASAI